MSVDRLNLLLRRALKRYDRQPFIWAMLLSNLLVFVLGIDWVLNSPLLAIPTLAFIALWASLLTGSLLEYLRYRLIRWLHHRGAPPDSEMHLTHAAQDSRVEP